MKEVFVDPRKLIVPGEIEVSRPGILDAYFVAYIAAKGKSLPPVIIGRPSFRNYHWTQGIQDRSGMGIQNPLVDAHYWRNTYYERIHSLMERGAEFYLYDGNHRSLAAYFTGNEVAALKLETDTDIDELRRMKQRGYLVNLPSPLQRDLDLQALEATFENFCCGRLDLTTTFDSRAHRLINESSIDPRIVKYYKTDRWWRENIRVSMW